MKDKYLQIFKYLLEFSKIRSKAVRNIKNATTYTEILWMADLPINDLIDCVLHDNFTTDADYWIKISKPKEPEKPQFPSPPQKIEKWIKSDTLLNKNEFPVLLNEIVDENNVAHNLENNFTIKSLFDSYCENRWFSDSEEYWKKYEIYEQKYLVYENVNNNYKKLFTIFNKSQQFGEEYELVMGLGLMYFQEDENTPLICRHIITSKAEISFEYSKRDSSLVVKQSLSDGLVIETDAIIDLFEQFESNDILEAEKKAIELIKEKELANPFDSEIHDVLQLLAERIKPGDGNYKNINNIKEVPNKETIFFAPALILRKRNTRSFTAFYEKIISDIEEGIDVDIPALNDIVEFDNKPNFPQNNGTEEYGLNDSETIYFPKKYNDEQIAIVNKAKSNNKVLVQGPPGTGKSHTIANLICHLLANGKKVLITAYTKRALEVLQDKLPDEFKDLTVNLLSGDSSSIKDLEASVHKINENLSNIDIDSLTEEIEELEGELLELKENRAYDKNELFKIKEKSSRKIEINSNYYGTITEIAERLEKEKDIYQWYKDDFYDLQTSNELIRNLKSYIPQFNNYALIDHATFNSPIPKKQQLFSFDDFKFFCQKVNQAKIKNISSETVSKVKSSNFSDLMQVLSELKTILINVENQQHPFKDEIIKEIYLSVFRNNGQNLQRKIDNTKNILLDIERYDTKQIDRDKEIKYPKNRTLRTIKSDANALLEFLNAGNALSGIGFSIRKPFWAKEIKEKLYFLDSVFINDSPCDTKDELIDVLNDIALKQNFEELNEIWNNDKNTNISFYNNYIFYKEIYDNTITLLENFKLILEKSSLLESLSNITNPIIKIEQLRKTINDVSGTLLLNKISEFENKKSEIINYLSDNDFHSISLEIIYVIKELNIASYEKILLKINDLENNYSQFQSFKNIESELTVVFPFLIQKVKDNDFTISDISKLEDAILFKHANSELERLLSEDEENRLIQLINSYDSEEESLIAKIAAKKSWVIVLKNLKNSPNLRQHLEAWVQANKKMGKPGSKSKRAFKFRKIAQNEMEYCKTSIPCWIMPLYKVAETIKPEQELYDYVIIDEASQLGPDAIFLLYISKKIIIVGDDKQTSPEYIGVDGNAMVPFINKHLQGIPFKDFYGTESSFFDYAKIFCGDTIVLREHFRCMPEIIEFSNKLFYAPEGKSLYPLKQYSENRLEPLQHVYCQNGFVDGSRQSIRNKPEAEILVNKILEIIDDKKYSDKTIGVISLQGNMQSSLIEGLLINKIGEKEFNKRKIICGKSASFQGDERDIIFLSLVTAENHPRHALMRPEDERRFNVAVSRAIEQIWLFHSVLPEDLSNKNDLRYKLLDHFINHKPYVPSSPSIIIRTQGNQPEPFDSWFEVDVFNDIVEKGHRVIPQYEVAKGRYRIDLVAIFRDGTKLAIECDGDRWHGAEQYQNDLMRQKVLERLGWEFFRIKGGEYYLNREKALSPLWEIFDTKQATFDEYEEIEEEEPEIGNSGNGDIYDDNIEDNTEHIENKIENIKTSDKYYLFDFNEFLAFTDQNNVYKIRNKGFGSVEQIILNVEKEEGEEFIFITGTTDYSGYMLFGFENGKVAKIYMESYKTLTQRKRLRNAYCNHSNLVFIENIHEDIDIAVISDTDKVVVFNTNQINPKGSKSSQGNQVIKLKNESKMFKLKKISDVTFKSIDYYRKNIPASGNYLLSRDDF